MFKENGNYHSQFLKEGSLVKMVSLLSGQLRPTDGDYLILKSLTTVNLRTYINPLPVNALALYSSKGGIG